MTGQGTGASQSIGGYIRVGLVMMLVAALFVIAPPARAEGTVSIANGSATEGAVVDFVVTLSEDPTVVVSVNYATSDGSATTADSDYSSMSGMLTFNPSGPLTQTISVPTGNDSKDEPNETFSVTLSNAVNTTVSGSNPATGTIIDNDTAPTVSIANGSAAEGSSIDFVVTLSAPSGLVASVYYATSDGSATTADSDYSSMSGTLAFIPGGPLAQTISVPTGNDSKDEPNETFSVTLSNAVNTTVSGSNPATGTIIDNDTAPTVSIANGSAVEGAGTMPFNVTLSAASGWTTSVSYATTPGTAGAPADFGTTSGTLTFDPGDTSESFTVPIVGDSLDEPNEIFAVNLSSPSQLTVGDGAATGTITDDDPTPSLSVNSVQAEEGLPVVFTVTLSAASGRTVTVNRATANGTATAPADYSALALTTLTFTPGQTTKNVSVATVEDATNEANETLRLVLSGASNATISTANGTGTILNDDGAPGLSALDAAPAAEGSPGVVFTISLLPASGQTVRVNYATADGTAKASSDYTATTGFVEFTPGQTSKTVMVPITNDTADEVAESLVLNLSSPVNAAIADAQASGSILDNDNVAPVAYVATFNQVGDSMFQFATGEVVKAGVTFTDPGVADAHSGTIDWGDGSAPTALTLSPVGTRSFEGTHAFANAGFYKISVSVADADGGVGVDEAYVTVSGPGVGSAEDTLGLVDPTRGLWRLYSELGVAVTDFYYGNPGDYPFMGDWNGDGISTPGLYRQSDGYVYLRNSNTQGVADIKFFFGNPGDVPIAGDFNNDGFDTVSIYRPSNQTFYIINSLGSGDQGLGAADFDYVFGNPGDKPFVGDFDGDGIDTAGLHRESTGLVYFRNSHSQGNADHQFIYGDPNDQLVAGDWTSDGVDSPTIYRSSDQTFYIRYTNTQGHANATFSTGVSGWIPVAGVTGAG